MSQELDLPTMYHNLEPGRAWIKVKEVEKLVEAADVKAKAAVADAVEKHNRVIRKLWPTRREMRVAMEAGKAARVALKQTPQNYGHGKCDQ